MAKTKPKAKHGQGTKWFEEKSNKWRAQITTPAGKRPSFAHGNEEVVDDWLNEQRLLIGRNQHVEPTGITLKDWLTQYIEVYAKPALRDRSHERNQSVAKHIESIGNTALQKITPTHLQSLYNELADDGYSGETCRKVHILIKSALKQAVLNRLITNNPADAIKAPKSTREEVQVYTRNEIDLILKTAANHRWYVVILLAVTTGMRLGEVLGVRWRDISLDEAKVHVRQNLQVTKNGVIFEPPKTEKGKRRIPLPAETVEALKPLRKAWLADKLKHARSDDLVFVTKDYNPITQQNFLNRFWNPLIQKVEFVLNEKPIPNPMSEKKKLVKLLEEAQKKKGWVQLGVKNFHALRHTYATKLLASGVPIVDVSRVLGHAKVSTTLDIYGHALPENTKIIADKISDALLK